MECDIIVFQFPIIRILESHKQHTFTGSQVSELSFSFNSAVKIQITGVRVPVLFGSDRSDCINFRIDNISLQNNLRIIFPDFSSGYSMKSSEESTLRSKVHGRNALSAFGHWAQGTAKMKSRRSSPEKQNTAHIRGSSQKNSRSTCWWTFRQSSPRAKAKAMHRSE